METKKLIGYGSVILAGIGLIALSVGIHVAHKAKKAIKNVDLTVNKLADMTPVEVSDMILKKAAEKAADRAAEEAVEKVRKDINTTVYATVSSAYDDLEDTVRAKLNKAVDQEIDINELKQKVENRASSEIVAKFMENLSDYAGPIVSAIMSSKKKGNTEDD